MADWERGLKRPALERVPLLAEVLGVPPGSLFPGGEAEPPEWVDGPALPRTPVEVRLSRIEKQLDAILTEVRRLGEGREGPKRTSRPEGRR